MSATEVILLQRIEKLGQMGDVVKVKPGYARNFLLPQGKAIRSNNANRARFEGERIQLEANNLKRREEAERLAERMSGLTVVIIRSLYGSGSPRDIAVAAAEGGLVIDRQQVQLAHPIKTLGLSDVRVVLHPEVSIRVVANVARSTEEAERQARGERVGRNDGDDDDDEQPAFGPEEAEGEIA